MFRQSIALLFSIVVGGGVVGGGVVERKVLLNRVGVTPGFDKVKRAVRPINDDSMVKGLGHEG